LDSKPFEYYVHESLGSERILALNDSMKTYGGGTMWFLPGVHLVDTTIYYGPNCHYLGISGESDDDNQMNKSVLRMNPDYAGTRHHMHLFAPDPAYLNTAETNPWTGEPGKGFVRNVVIENLRLDVGTGSHRGEVYQSVPQAGVFLAGTTESRVENNFILNYLFGILATANECDSLFFRGDGDWSTKGWHNEIRGNSIANGGWRTKWNAGARDTMAVYGGAAILGVASNGVLIENNSLSFTGGPEIWLPHVSSALVTGNGIENRAEPDTLSPHVLIGYWEGEVSYKAETIPGVRNPYDSTHVYVNAEVADCAMYRYEGGTNNFAARGSRGVVLEDNRFELENPNYYPHIFVGPNARRTEISGNTLSGASNAIYAHHTVIDFGYGTILRDNAYPQDGPMGSNADRRSWKSGDKALWHHLASQPGGGVIYLEPITYYVDFSPDIPSGHLRIPSNTVVQGVPGKTVIKVDDDIDPARWDSDRGVFAIDHNSRNIVIRDITFDGNSSNQTGFTTEELWERKHIAIGIGESAGSPTDVVSEVTIEDCRFRDFVCSIAINSSCSFRGIRVRSNTFVPQISTAGRTVDPNTVAIRHEITNPVHETKGLSIRDNLIVDRGIGSLPGSPSDRVPCYLPSNTRNGGTNRVYLSVIQDNFVDVRAATRAARVDTLWHEGTKFRETPE
jgi:hypothetical protein